MSLPAEAELIQAALAASEHAYIPYSNYRVGAALLTTDGEVYSGCNVESASYTPTICAERTALVKAISEGKREFSAVAVVTRDGGSPCGVCRQLLFEFSPGMSHHGGSAGQCASAVTLSELRLLVLVRRDPGAAMAKITLPIAVCP